MESGGIQDFVNKMLSEKVFTCAICDNLLTLPVITVENVGNVCHNCFENADNKDKWNSVPNTKLNLILKNLQFPCRFEPDGCNSIFIYENLKDHEERCHFRPVDCLLPKEECKWRGTLTDLCKHFKEEHQKYVLNNPYDEFSCELNVIKCANVLKLLYNKNRVYIFRIKIFGKDNDLFHYVQDLKFSTENTEMVIKYIGENGQHKMKLRCLPFTSSCNEHNGKMIRLSTLQEIADSNGNIKIAIKTSNCELKNINFEVTRQLECPICKELMRPPIVQCTKGHSFCSNCRQRLTDCPTCRQSWSNPDIRNFALESLTPSVPYPCIHSQFGCVATFLGNEINSHEGICAYKVYSCPATGCHFTGNYLSCKNHFKHSHKDDLIEGSVFHSTFTPLANRGIATTHMKYFFEHENIYRLTFKRLADSCSWDIQILNSYDDRIKYFYTIDIVHPRIEQRGITKSNLCLSMNDKPTNETIVTFSYDLLGSYKIANTDQINYCCKIFVVKPDT